MRTFANKSKAIQHTKSPKATVRTRPQFGDSHEVNFIRRLQRTVGNQAVQRLLQAKTDNKKASSTSYATPGLGHDFSRIPVRADAINSNKPPNQNHCADA